MDGEMMCSVMQRRRKAFYMECPSRKHTPAQEDVETKNIYFSLATKWEDIDLTGGIPVREYTTRGVIVGVDPRRIRVQFEHPIRFSKDIPLERIPCTKYIYDHASATVLLVEFDANASFKTMEQLSKWKEFPLKPMFVSNKTLSRGKALTFKVLQFFNGDNKQAISISEID